MTAIGKIWISKVIVEEVGGKVTDLFGNEQRYDESINGAVISNGKVHNEVIETNKKYLKKLIFQMEKRRNDKEI